MLHQTNSTTPKVKNRETRRVYHIKQAHQNQTKVPTQHNNFDLSDVDHVSSNAKSSQFGAMLCILRTTKQWLKWSSKGRSPTMRYVSRTHRVSCSWLLPELIWIPRFKSSMSTPNTNSQTCWLKWILHVMSGTIFFICLTSAILAHFTGLGISAWPAPLKRSRNGCKKKGEKRIVAKSKPTLNLACMLRQVLRLRKVQLRRKVQGYSRHPDNLFGRVQGDL